MEKQDSRVKVKFAEKIVKVEDKGNTVEMQEFFKRPSGEIMKPGDEILVTRKAAVWLAANGFIEPLKKENKQAAKRETK